MPGTARPFSTAPTARPGCRSRSYRGRGGAARARRMHAAARPHHAPRAAARYRRRQHRAHLGAPGRRAGEREGRRHAGARGVDLDRPRRGDACRALRRRPGRPRYLRRHGRRDRSRDRPLRRRQRNPGGGRRRQRPAPRHVRHRHHHRRHPSRAAPLRPGSRGWPQAALRRRGRGDRDGHRPGLRRPRDAALHRAWAAGGRDGRRLRHPRRGHGLLPGRAPRCRRQGAARRHAARHDAAARAKP